MNHFVFFLVLLLSFLGHVTLSKAYAIDTVSTVHVLASTSLTKVVTELARNYSKEKMLTVSTSFASPRELAVTISEGESADVYIAEDPEALNSLKLRGLIDVYSLTPLASNRLVFVASSENRLHKKLDASLPLVELLKDINARTLMVAADPYLEPLGIATKQALSRLGYWKQIEPFLVNAATSDEALYLIAKGNSAGISYYTDAYQNDELRIISMFPEELHDPVLYQAAVVAGDNMSLAREFLEYLKSPKSREIFKKYGFLLL